ncbi:MAG: L-rhamnose mutarotase [Sedimentisphaerales bacterium]|nr:L-rhamnose mutarotase [Sedimentisphaerales bacterium]
MKKAFKRYCKCIELKSDPNLIREYKKLHDIGATWQEVTNGMKKIGILNMEIYISGTTLFMIMDTKADFNHEQAMSKLATLPRQSEWEALVSKYQQTSSDSSAGQKWKLLERIYKMDQKQQENPENGYIEGTYI